VLSDSELEPLFKDPDVQPARRDSLAILLSEANAMIINREAQSAGTGTGDQNIFQGWAEVRGRSKRFYSWKRRFIVFEVITRRLTVYSSESLLKQYGTFIVTDCNIPIRTSEPKFWQRSLRLDLAVSDIRRSPLSLNVPTQEAHTSWLRLFKREVNDLDITVDEGTRKTVQFQRLSKNATSKNKKSSLSDVQNQIASLSKAPILKNDVRVMRSDRPEYAKIISSSPSTHNPLSTKETLKLFASGDPSIARLIDHRKQRELNIFLSCSNLDFILERSLLNADVFPYLREVGKTLGIEVNLPCDLTLVPSYFKNVHATESLRNAEIKRCRETSVGYSYVQLFGQTYGPNVLPTLIPAHAFDDIMCVMEENEHIEEVVLLTTWYHLDDNAVPPQYKLQPINTFIHDYLASDKQKQEEAEQQWLDTVEKLEAALTFATTHHLDDDWRETYQTSELHSEFKQGILSQSLSENAKSSFAFVREFENIDLSSPLSLNFCDLREESSADANGNKVFFRHALDTSKRDRLQDLKTRLMASKTKTIETKLPTPASLISTPPHPYLQNFLDTFCDSMVESLLSAAPDSEREPTPLEADVAAHVEIATNHSNYFFPTTTLVDEISSVFDYLDDRDNTSPIYVHGPKGIGKTSFMSHILKEVNDVKDSGCCVMIRFIGSGHSTTTGIELLSSLCEQMISTIALIDKNFEPVELPHTFEEMSSVFPKTLALFSERKINLVILIDGCDELQTTSLDSSLVFSWIPSILPRGVKLILSSDSACSLHKQLMSLSNSQVVELHPWSEVDATRFIKAKLKDRGRTINEAQSAYISECLSPFCTPLTAQLVMHEASSWPSYLENVESIPIRNQSDSLIDKMLDKLEKKHGPIVVRTTFGYLFYSVEGGLSTNELLDVLSIDDKLLNMLEKVLPPDIFKLQRRFPSVLLTRILQECVDILEKRSTADGTIVWSFSHKQIHAAVGRRTKNMESNFRNNLADYFSGRYSKGKPLTPSSKPIHRYLDPQNLINKQGSVNIRRIMELPHHLIALKEWKRLAAFLSNLNVLDVLGHRGSRRSMLRPGTARAMLLKLWTVWQSNTSLDVSVQYMKSFSSWQKETTPSLRDSNRRMKSIAVFLKDLGAQNTETRYFEKARQIFDLLLKREIMEFGEHHPAVDSTRRMLGLCEQSVRGNIHVPRSRRGTVGTRRNSNIITPMKKANEQQGDVVSPALSKRIEESPIILSPIKREDEGEEESVEDEIKKVMMEDSYENGGIEVSFNTAVVEDVEKQDSYFSHKEETL